MIIDSILPVVGTLLGTLLGAGLQYWNSRKSAEEASERIFERQAAESKFERLERVHDTLDECVNGFSELSFRGPKDFSDYTKNVQDPYDKFADAVDKSKIYLTEDERNSIEDTREEFNKFRHSLEFSAREVDDQYYLGKHDPDEIPDREEIDAAAEEVFTIIRKKLDPEANDD